MDNRPIGVFDSGVGGLTAVRRLHEILPHEDIIYFGDTGRVPYGTRSAETILKYTRQDVRFLRKFDIKAIVVACNTVSATALDIVANETDVPMIGVVWPACAAARVVYNAADVHGLAVLPQALQAVEGPGLLIEHMDGDAAVVQQDPRAAAIALPVQGLLTGLLCQQLFHIAVFGGHAAADPGGTVQPCLQWVLQRQCG